MVGLGNVDNTSDASKPVSTATQTALDLKAPLASPTFTGTPLAPTPTVGDNTTKVATTAFVTNAVSTATSGAFVDLTTGQTIAGTKVFSSNASFNGQKIGKGNAMGGQNLAVGDGAMNGGGANGEDDEGDGSCDDEDTDEELFEDNGQFDDAAEVYHECTTQHYHQS